MKPLKTAGFEGQTVTLRVNHQIPKAKLAQNGKVRETHRAKIAKLPYFSGFMVDITI